MHRHVELCNKPSEQKKEQSKSVGYLMLYLTSTSVRLTDIDQQPTGRLLADNVPTTYQQLTNNLPTTYQQLTNNLPATHQQLTNNLPTTYQQLTNN